MKRLLCAAALALTAATASATDVGVSVSIGQPGFYGTIDIGNYSRPEVIYAEPVIIRRTTVIHEPVYLRVPPGHAKKWSRYCRRYNACNRPAYFVRDDWYNNVYAPEYRERHGKHDRDDHPGKGHGHGKGHHKHDH